MHLEEENIKMITPLPGTNFEAGNLVIENKSGKRANLMAHNWQN